MLEAQGSKCAICEQPMKKVCVDHDHKTQKVRGLLCQTCNIAVGLLHDDVNIFINAVGYLMGERR